MTLIRKELAAAVRLLKSINAKNAESEKLGDKSSIELTISENRISILRWEIVNDKWIREFKTKRFEKTKYYEFVYIAECDKRFNSLRGSDKFVASIEEMTELVTEGKLPVHLK